MPLEFVDRGGPDGGGEWIIAGRVIANPSVRAVLVATGAERVLVHGAVDGLAPGDLVRIRARALDHAEHAASADPSADPRGFDAHNVELVFRPTRAPFSPDSETAAMLGGALRERLELRAAVIEKIRQYFKREGFLEVETPLIAASPGLDLHLHAYAVTQPTASERSPDESGQRQSVPPPPGRPFGYLITSPEYHMKRMLVGGVNRCFQLARCFRANEVGARHEPEFTMLEWYRAWASSDAMMADTENVLRAAASAGPTPGRFVMGNAEVDLAGPFERLTVREAFTRHAPAEGDPVILAQRDEEHFFAVLVARIEPQLGRGRPTFLSRYPARHASLSRLAPDDPTVCERFELYANGIELSNGFVELTDPVEQRLRLERDSRDRAARRLPSYPIDERFLHALEEGMPPSVGNAMGLDRLVALVAGRTAVADVMAFAHKRR